MVEPLLEAAVAALFAEVDATVISSWGTANTGEVKGELEKSDAAVISISVGAPEYDQYTVPSCTIPVGIVVEIRREAAPTGAALLTVMEPIADVLNELQEDVSSVEALTVAGFEADGVRLDGGSAPVFDKQLNAWRVIRSLSVRGRIVAVS